VAHDYQHINPDPLADSAGVPWEGRHLEPNPHANDDGTADPALLAIIDEFKAGKALAEAVVVALGKARLLVPLVANLGEAGQGAHGQVVDKSADLSIVSVQSPDGQIALPVFSSVAAMQVWNPKARPVPIETARVALAAASEKNNRIILDPGSPTQFAVRQNAYQALAQQLPWIHPSRDPEVKAAFKAAIDAETAVENYAIQDGDPAAALTGPEVLVYLKLAPGLTQLELDQVLERLGVAWAASPEIALKVDSLGIKLV
jgi:SseB protein N-terminal domain